MPVVGILWVVLVAQSYNISATLPSLLLRLFAQNKQIAREKKKNLCLPTHNDNGKRYRNRKGKLSESEVMTILICYHFGTYRNFKEYYLNCIRGCNDP